MGLEKEKQREYPEAYSSIPKGPVIKAEETFVENNVELQVISGTQTL